MEVRMAVSRDLLAISENLRESDLAEIKAFAGTDPFTALVTSKMHSDSTIVGLLDGEPVVVVGFADVGTIMQPLAAPWFVATPRISEVSIRVLRESRKYVARAINRYGILAHWVDSENHTSMKWLRWLGFNIEEDRFMDTGGRRFYYFSQMKELA